MISSGVKPNIICYNTVLNACAYDISSAEQAYETALQVMKRMHSTHHKPNNITYMTMIRACQNLIQSKTYRDEEVERIFLESCKRGECCDTVLRSFKYCASVELQLRLFCCNETELAKIMVENLSESCSRNVKMRCK